MANGKTSGHVYCHGSVVSQGRWWGGNVHRTEVFWRFVCTRQKWQASQLAHTIRWEDLPLAVCELHMAYYFAACYTANSQCQEIWRAVIPVASDHRRAETKSDRWHQIHRGSLETSTVSPSTASYLRFGRDDPSKKITCACTEQYVSSTRNNASDKNNHSMVRLYQLNEL